MKTIRIEIPSIKHPIQPSPGFAKKDLADVKLDIEGLCEFGCAYCSSNSGNYLRINREHFARLTEQQTGVRLLPADEPALMFTWPGVLERLQDQLASVRAGYGVGKTLVFSMLTDGFSPTMVKEGITEGALRLVLERTEYRVRVLTKNAIVGSDYWIDFFKRYPRRFVVGLSIGTLDDQWAKRVELRTSLPTARLRALRNLQDAGVSTFCMFCPMFPHVLHDGSIHDLIEQSRPDHTDVENVWAEPFNDRDNWTKVSEGYEQGTWGRLWFDETYGARKTENWSRYATDLYLLLRAVAKAGGWTHKLRYLLYEDQIQAVDAQRLDDLSGILLQSKPAADRKSQNVHIARLQTLRERRSA